MNIVEKTKIEGALCGALSIEQREALVKAVELIKKYDILKEVNKIFEIGLLSPLKLDNSEFTGKTKITINNNKEEVVANDRYDYIYKSNNGKILNTNAYNLFIRAKYNHDNGKQEEFKPIKSNYQSRIYISKGGVITGEYIEDCIIREDIVNKHTYTIQSIPVIPVAMIARKEETYYVVDHREPKLKALQAFYDVPVYIDEKVQKYRMNLRKYIKFIK